MVEASFPRPFQADFMLLPSLPPFLAGAYRTVTARDSTDWWIAPLQFSGAVDLPRTVYILVHRTCRNLPSVHLTVTTTDYRIPTPASPSPHSCFTRLAHTQGRIMIIRCLYLRSIPCLSLFAVSWVVFFWNLEDFSNKNFVIINHTLNSVLYMYTYFV
jgi:hypothetical protein